MRALLSFLTVCFIFALPLHARKVYMKMQLEEGYIFFDNSATVDDGTGSSAVSLRGEDGKKLKFKTEISALNYLSSLGWDLFQAIVIPKNQDSNQPLLGKTMYILVKDVTDEEMDRIAQNGIIAKKKKDKKDSDTTPEE